MVSTYGYTTVSKLQKFAIMDYSAVDALLTDTIIEAQITAAEQFINTYCGTIWTGTIPPGIELVTNMIAKILINNWLVDNGVYSQQQKPMVRENILDNLDIVAALEAYKKTYDTIEGIWISKESHTNGLTYPYNLSAWKWR